MLCHVGMTAVRRIAGKVRLYLFHKGWVSQRASLRLYRAMANGILRENTEQEQQC